MRVLLLIILFIHFNIQELKAQDTLSNRIDIQIGMTRMDFFGGIQYAKEFGALQPFIAAEIGINRTIFQSRFYPKITVGSSYFVIDKKRISFGPQVSYAYSVLKVNANSSHFHHWNEVYAGLRLEIGSTIRFTTALSGGWMNERFYNQITQDFAGVNSLGYSIKLGLSYAW